MPVAYIDHVENLEQVEKNGVIRALTRLVRVMFNEAEIEDHKDFSRLKEAYNAVDPQGFPMPLPFSGLSEPGYDALVLVERSAKLVEKEPSFVDVTLKYEHILDGPNQELQAPLGNILYGKGRSSIVEKTTNFYRKEGNPNAPRTLILAAHSFNPQEKGLSGQFAFPLLPYTIIQGGEVSIPYPQENFSLTGVITVDNPHRITRDFVSKINKDRWLGQPKHTWICSEVQWQVLSPKNGIYQFNFEFQYSVDTWNPTVVFHDQRTGRPPAKVREGDLEDPTQPGSGVMSYTLNPYSGAAGLAAAVAAQAAVLAAGGTVAAAAAAYGAAILPYLQPAGIWNVPALEPVDFDRMFGAIFEGFEIPGVN